ncbi:hypothetical protein RRG08_026253 [Elysia crispata]|uniref:Uncharacterized protein n=1 Tax=Elysia crispata TaxID=231223 RepID=A0AAE1DCV8_9GAST|nr:hypothetical protein RRG08_026253 [Elysia crispata]
MTCTTIIIPHRYVDDVKAACLGNTDGLQYGCRARPTSRVVQGGAPMSLLIVRDWDPVSFGRPRDIVRRDNIQRRLHLAATRPRPQVTFNFMQISPLPPPPPPYQTPPRTLCHSVPGSASMAVADKNIDGSWRPRQVDNYTLNLRPDKDLPPQHSCIVFIKLLEIS